MSEESETGLGEWRRCEHSRVEQWSDLTSSFRLVISASNLSRLKEWDEGPTADILGLTIVGRLGVATSMILLARLASSEIGTVSLAAARTILTFNRSLCKKSSRRKAPSVQTASTVSCCRQRRNCRCLRSPNSSAPSSCWKSLLLRDSSVLDQLLFKGIVLVSSGGVRIKSRTLVATSSDKEAMT